MTSEDQMNYPVWKNDFEMNGRVEKCFYTILGICILPSTVYFNCSEDAPLTIEHAIGSEIIDNIPNGTFYCYNEEADLKLDEHDDVFLNITSHWALWPGQYNLTARMYYLNDTYSPIVVITNKDAFDRYYRELDNIEVYVEINDINLEDYWGTIFTLTQNITVPFSHKIGGIYYFTKILPIDIPEGDFELGIFAEDSSGLVGSDNVTLKIDRTSPTIILIEPSGGVYDDVIPIELNVTDKKSGVDNSSVFYRISEIVNGTFCPDTGIIFGNFSCYNSGWLPTTYNETSEHYHDEFNSTPLNSGDYWFEAKAKDILGNEGFL